MNHPPRSIQNDLAAKTRLGAIDLLNPPCGRRVMEVHQLRYRATEAAATIPVRVDRDQQVVEALRLREPTAAERLVATYGDRAYRLAIGITGNRPDAEEAVQDAFWNVVRKIDTFRGDSSLGSWIYRITANAAYQKLRGAHAGATTSRWTKSFPPSTRMGVMPSRSATGRRAPTTRPCRPNFGPRWTRRLESSRPITAP